MGDIYINTQIQPETDILNRFSKIITKVARITGTGTVNTNVLQLVGSIRILNQWAIIKSVTTLTNMTNIYADLWDGTNSVLLTKNTGATLSGAPVGTFFTKDQLVAEPYSISLADQCRMLENAHRIAIPFTVTQKNGANTYIRFNYTTTDAPVDFTMQVWFEYEELDGGTLAFL
jgi:hypothetical protein